MKRLLKRHTISFKNAFSGLFWSLKTQPNYLIHLTLSLLAIIGGFILKITYWEWLIIGLLIIIGLVIETINTAIEVTTDAISNQWQENIKLAKDVSAAAMLIFALGSLFIAIIIFIPKIILIFFL